MTTRTLIPVRLGAGGGFTYVDPVVRCRCLRPLAMKTPDGRFASRHRGRVYRLGVGDEITCECGHLTTLERLP